MALRLLAAVTLLASATLPALAQTGGLSVEVRDAESRDPLPGATVSLSSTQGLIAPTASLTDPAGVVRFPVLRAGGGYTVRVSLPGYASQRMSELRVGSNETENPCWSTWSAPGRPTASPTSSCRNSPFPAVSTRTR